MKKVQISFDPTEHKYTDDEGNVYTSVTTLLKQFENDYDSEFWAMYRALDQMGYKLKPNTESRKIWVQNGNIPGGWFDLASLYNGIFKTYKTPSQIKAEWVAGAKQSTDRGTEKHNQLEDAINAWYDKYTPGHNSNPTQSFAIRILNVEQLKNSPLAFFEPEVYDMFKKLIDAGYVIYAEQRVYSYDHKVSGTIDVLAVRGKEFWIVDWKTNKNELKFESGYYKKAWDNGRQAKLKTAEFIAKDERLHVPLNHLQKSKGTIYTLQLSLYAYICELWGLTCNGLILVHIRPMLDAYDNEILGNDGKVRFYPAKFYTLPYLKNEIHTVMQNRLVI